MGNRSFDGAGDSIDFGSDASIDSFVQFSCAMWMFAASWGNNEYIMGKGTSLAGGGWNVLIDAGSNPRGFQFIRNWTGAIGNFVAPAFTDSQRVHVCLAYDGTAAGNTPTLFVNGVAASFTTLGTPSGTLTDDAGGPLRIGEATDGTGDASEEVLHYLYDNTIFTAAEANRAQWWGRPRGGMKVYHPMYTDKLANEGTAVANGTAVGAVMANAFCPPCVRPGSGMGW